MLDQLGAIGVLAMKNVADNGPQDVLRACEIVREALGAAEAYVIRAGDPHFIKIGSAELPTEYELKQRGYWLVWKELAANPDIPALRRLVTENLAGVERALAVQSKDS